MTVKEYVALEKEKLSKEISNLSTVPTLSIIQVNDDPASNSYIRGKIKDAKEIGAKAILTKLPLETTEEELLKLIDEQNNDDSIHGIIVQMPLPKSINEEHIKLAVSPKKDVDGFHPLSTFNACTPKGIIDYLKSEHVEIDGKNAVMIGRSNIVGKPMAKLLLKENANVTILHSHTSKEDMFNYVMNADIIIIAIGSPAFLNDKFIYKKDAVIVDVGINRVDDELVGDVAPNLPVKLQTPVPGGVGLLTRLSLMKNLLEATKNGF